MTTLTKRSSSRSKQVRGFVVTWLALTFVIAAVTFFAVYLTYGGNETPSFARNVAFPSATPPVDTGAAAVGAVGTLLPTLEQAAPTATPTAMPTVAPTEAPTEASADTAGTGGEARTVAQAATPEPTPTPQPAINNRNFQLGIQVQTSPDLNPENQDIWVRDVTGKLGMRWFKQQVRWEYIEPQQGQYDWNPVRLGIESAERFGSNIMLSVVTAPEWAREAGAPLDKHGPPADPQQFVAFVTAMINEFPGKIDAIEVWNEQNIDREWASPRGLIAADYVDLLRRTYEAVKAIDPNIIIISGALSPSGGWVDNGVTTAVDDFTYFDAMLDAGMLNYTDCVGAHHNGYNIGPSVTWDNVPNDPNAEFRGPFDNPHHSWSFRSTLETYANRVQLKGGDQKLCVTEFGWASVEDLDGYPAGFEFAKDNTLEEQKMWTVEAVNNMRDWDIVWLAFLWNFNYGPQAGWDPSNDNVPYSIVGPDWVHRPVYDAIAEWSAQNAATQIGQ
jgi:hypothetical protein